MAADRTSYSGDPSQTSFGSQGQQGEEEQMKQAAEGVKESVRDAQQTAKEAGRSAMEEARRATHEARERIKARGEETVQRQKERAAHQIGSFGSAAKRAANQLREEQDETLAQYAERLANSMDRAADYLRTHDVRDLYQKVEGFTRRHPEIVLGGLFIAGLAAARVLKAAPPEEEYGYGYGGESSYEPESYETDPEALYHSTGMHTPQTGVTSAGRESEGL